MKLNGKLADPGLLEVCHVCCVLTGHQQVQNLQKLRNSCFVEVLNTSENWDMQIYSRCSSVMQVVFVAK